MSETGKRIAQARMALGWNQSELGRRLGVKPQSVQAWEAGKNMPRPQKLQEIASMLGKSVAYLMGEEAASNAGNVDPRPIPVNPSRLVPIKGTAQMGREGYWQALDDSEGFVEAYSDDKEAYALRLKGDSMFPAIRDGWLAVCEPSKNLERFEYVMVRLKDEESMLKELLEWNSEEVVLESVNKEYGRRRIPMRDIEAIHHVGAIVPPSKIRS